jgi:hypothetical protein
MRRRAYHQAAHVVAAVVFADGDTGGVFHFSRVDIDDDVPIKDFNLKVDSLDLSHGDMMDAIVCVFAGVYVGRDMLGVHDERTCDINHDLLVASIADRLEADDEETRAYLNWLRVRATCFVGEYSREIGVVAHELLMRKSLTWAEVSDLVDSSIETGGEVERDTALLN